jgi:hypothetical protein
MRTLSINLNEIVSDTIKAIEYCEMTDTTNYRCLKKTQLKLWESDAITSLEAVYLIRAVYGWLDNNVSLKVVSVDNWDQIERWFDNYSCLSLTEALERAEL